MIIKILNNIKQIFTVKQVTILPLVFLTLGLFIFNKILHLEWYFSIIGILFFSLLLPKCIKPEWEQNFLKSKIFEFYLNLMFLIESLFTSSTSFQFITGFYIAILFEIFYQSENVLTAWVALFIVFLFLLYFRLRSQIFSINEIAYDFYNDIPVRVLENHFLKILGVKINLQNTKLTHKFDSFRLVAIPKRPMFSRAFSQAAGKATGVFGGGGILGYFYYSVDSEASARNQSAFQAIDRMNQNFIELNTQYYLNKNSLTTHQQSQIEDLLSQSEVLIRDADLFARKRNITLIRVLNDPILTDRYFTKLHIKATNKLALIESQLPQTGIKPVNYDFLVEYFSQIVSI
jgi:hypothetical protein